MTVELVPLECGWIQQAGSVLEVGAADAPLEIPIPAWLIRHPKETLLFDAGLHPDLAHSPETLGRLASLFTPMLDEGGSIGGRLQAAGVDPQSSLTVIVSHCHFDHVGGLCELPNARLVVQQVEWRTAAGGDGLAYDPALYDLGHELTTVDGECDLLGDGTITCLPTPGHTAGHQSLRIVTSNGPVVLAADACYFARTLDGGPLPPFSYDLEAQKRSLARLRAERSAGAEVIPGHDPEIWRRLVGGKEHERPASP
jgi:glyoxylase-like metal-dependent hydrolase (beta-lactamase superfamily II)